VCVCVCVGTYAPIGSIDQSQHFVPAVLFANSSILKIQITVVEARGEQ